MKCDFNRFRKWAERRFGEDIIVTKTEIRLNSIFADYDNGHHLWCSPSGGKKKRKGGVFHCFKTDRKGTLIKLVQFVESCDRDEAVSILSGQPTIRQLEKELEEFYLGQETKPKVVIKPIIALPPDTHLISALPAYDRWRKTSESYLLQRCIPIDGFWICVKGQYRNRIVIPYYGRDGQLIYWNTRSLNPVVKLRYLGPPKECGIGKSDVVYMPGAWPRAGDKVFLCEGEFNAKSVALTGLIASACGGKNMSEKQALEFKDCQVVLCLDRDKPGLHGTSAMTEKIASIESALGTQKKLSYVRPPEGFNDWNQMLVKDGPVLLRAYLERYQKPLNFQAPFGTSGDYFAFRDL